jgi:hypothetical protein
MGVQGNAGLKRSFRGNFAKLLPLESQEVRWCRRRRGELKNVSRHRYSSGADIEINPSYRMANRDGKYNGRSL